MKKPDVLPATVRMAKKIKDPELRDLLSYSGSWNPHELVDGYWMRLIRGIMELEEGNGTRKTMPGMPIGAQKADREGDAGPPD